MYTLFCIALTIYLVQAAGVTVMFFQKDERIRTKEQLKDFYSPTYPYRWAIAQIKQRLNNLN